MKKPGWVAAALLAGAEATAQTASAVEPEAAEPGPVAAEPARRWAAAAGAVASVGPEFAGASRIGVNLQPGFAVRWGRVSLASRSAFAVRSEGAALRSACASSKRDHSGGAEEEEEEEAEEASRAAADVAEDAAMLCRRRGGGRETWRKKGLARKFDEVLLG